MKRAIQGGALVGILVSFISLTFSFTASAHVVVTPGQVETSQRTTFAVSVPNEHDTAVVGVRLVIPEGLTSVRPYVKSGWDVNVKTTGEGESLSATEITWTSAGATVPVNLKDDFLFSAKAPAAATELKWKAYETYQNGLVVAWEQTPSDSESTKPYSITQVVNETEQDAVLRKASDAAQDAKSTANRSLYVGIAGIIVGLAAIFIATRKK